MKNLLVPTKLCLLLFLVGLVSCTEDEPIQENSKPQISDQNFEIPFKSPNDFEVGIIKATDADNDPLTFSITSGNGDAAFSIGSETGKITISDSSKFNTESGVTTLIVQVSDGKLASTATITITIGVKNNTAPETGENMFSLAQNTAVGTTIGKAFGFDGEGDPLIFSITDGNTDSAFAINNSTGDLSVNNPSALDFEVKSQFLLTYTVSDGEFTTSGTITVDISKPLSQPYTTMEQIDNALATAYLNFEDFVMYVYTFDAVYSEEISAPDNSWDNVATQGLSSVNLKPKKLWDDSYESILILNNIIASIATVTPAGQQQDEITGQAKTARAYCYMVLANWFGGVPLEQGINVSEIGRATEAEIITQIKADLTSAISVLPQSWPGSETNKFTKATAQALLARLHLKNQEYSSAMTLSEQLISSTEYSLSSTPNALTKEDPEIIWGFDPSDDAFKSVYTRGMHVPLVRYTETLLINAESNIMIGQSQDATTTVNLIRTRSGEAELGAGISQSDLLAAVFVQWKSEMSFGGVTFSALKRFGKATEELNVPMERLLLPIPQDVLDSNPNITQNPGY